MTIFLFVLGIVLFSFLIIAHEFGHFILARRNGVEVEEFGFFFPPHIWSKKMKSGFTLSINAIPVGGFVRLKGEHDADMGKGSFGEASLWTKTKIMVAGVFMNLLLAFLILTVLAVVGMPQLLNNQYTVKSDTKTVPQKIQVISVEPNSPASTIGLKNNDVLISIGSTNSSSRAVNSTVALPTLTKSLAGQLVNVTYMTPNGKTETKLVRLRTNKIVIASESTKNPVGYLGVETGSSQFVIQKSTWSAPIVALGLMKQVVVLTFQGLGHVIGYLFRGQASQASSQVNGPVGVVVILKNSASLGYQFVLFIIAIISLSLAIFNILPIPALDGGRLFFTLIPRVFGRHALKQRTEEWIHGAGLAILLVLFLLITISDISHIK